MSGKTYYKAERISVLSLDGEGGRGMMGLNRRCDGFKLLILKMNLICYQLFLMMRWWKKAELKSSSPLLYWFSSPGSAICHMTLNQTSAGTLSHLRPLPSGTLTGLLIKHLVTCYCSGLCTLCRLFLDPWSKIWFMLFYMKCHNLALNVFSLIVHTKSISC